VEQGNVRGRYARKAVDAVALDGGKHGACIEAWMHDDGGTAQVADIGDEQAIAMCQRQYGQLVLTRAFYPVFTQATECVARQIAVRKHDSLGSTGSAGSINGDSGIIRAERYPLQIFKKTMRV